MSSLAPPNQGNNPVMEAYERWSSQTPFVARSTMIMVLMVYIISFFFDAEMSLGNIPYYTVFNFEIYRILLSFLVGNSILSLVMLAFFFPAMAGRMENSIGSSGLLVLMGTVGLLVNVIFDIICICLNYMGRPEALFSSCENFWVIVFGLITIECMQIPDAPRRMLFIPVDIPSKYFPLVLYAFFCLFSGLVLSYFLSIVVGYCYATGYIDKLKVSDTRLGQSEATGILSGLSRRTGWVPIGSALGHQAWSVQEPSQGQSRQSASSSGVVGTRGGPRVFGYGEDQETGSSNATQEKQPLIDQFPGSGRTLSSGGGRAAASREQIAAQRLAALGLSATSTAGASAPVGQNSDVSRLVDMGFPRSAAHDALTKANGSYEEAVDILMSGRR